MRSMWSGRRRLRECCDCFAVSWQPCCCCSVCVNPLLCNLCSASWSPMCFLYTGLLSTKALTSIVCTLFSLPAWACSDYGQLQIWTAYSFSATHLVVTALGCCLSVCVYVRAPISLCTQFSLPTSLTCLAMVAVYAAGLQE